MNNTVDQSKLPIAVFDSGVGGLSVLREIIKEMPWEDFIYYGDPKNAPQPMKEDALLTSPLEYTNEELL